MTADQDESNIAQGTGQQIMSSASSNVRMDLTIETGTVQANHVQKLKFIGDALLDTASLEFFSHAFHFERAANYQGGGMCPHAPMRFSSVRWETK